MVSDERAQAVARAYFLLRLVTGWLGAAFGVILAAPLAALLGYPNLTPYQVKAVLRTVAANAVG